VILEPIPHNIGCVLPRPGYLEGLRQLTRRHGTVTDLVVHEDWRGRGIGRMLLAEAERLTRAEGLKRLVIGVLVANEKAERTYRNFGFEPYVAIMKKEL
jgi:ribosomal protein S18 acetylase RimI-like enzyme